MSQEARKPTCFVIQQFDDDGTYDRRYVETIRPALTAAGVEPVRADAILGLTPIINKIETAIKDASLCIAEVSTDNPNVWLELGYALALNRPTVILCDKQVRSKLPFDISHRPVVLYRSDSRSGFEELEKNIIKLVKNQLDEAKRIEESPILTTGPKDLNDLKGCEIAIIATLMTKWASSPDGIGHWEIEKDLKHLGFADLELSLGVANLLSKNYISQDSDGDRDHEWYLYRITPEGVAWLQANEGKVELKTPEPKPGITQHAGYEDDIPF
jgi:hypothetical protein